MSLPILCCWQQHPSKGKHRDTHELDIYSDSEGSDTGGSTDTSTGSVDTDSDFTISHDHTDSLFFPGLHCCDAPIVDSPRSEGPRANEDEEIRDYEGSSKSRVIEERDLTKSFIAEAEHMPGLAIPQDSPHLIIKDQHLKDLTLEQLEDALLEDCLLEQYLAECSKSYDISLSFWGTTTGGIRVRRAQFIMPVPQEVPPALARLISVPEVSRATLVLGFVRSKEDELVVFVQQLTHDVPYGENFRVQETMVFRPHPQGGLVYSKCAFVKWLKALPWLVSPMRPITESKTAAGAAGASEAFLKAVRNAVS